MCFSKAGYLSRKRAVNGICVDIINGCRLMREKIKTEQEEKIKSKQQEVFDGIGDYILQGALGNKNRKKSQTKSDKTNKTVTEMLMSKKEKPMVYGTSVMYRYSKNNAIKLGMLTTTFAVSVVMDISGCNNKNEEVEMVSSQPAEVRDIVPLAKKRKIGETGFVNMYCELLDDTYSMISKQIFYRKELQGMERAILLKNTNEANLIFPTSEPSTHRLLKKLNRTEQEELLLKERLDLADAILSSVTESDANLGERRLYEFIEKLFSGHFIYHGSPLYFLKFQSIFLNLIIPTLAPLIVGSAWDTIGPRLRKQFSWDKQNYPDVLIAQTPRRFGKTMIIAVVALCFELIVQDKPIAIFSTCGRISGFLQETIMEVLRESGYGPWIVSTGKEWVYLRDPNDVNSRIRKIFSYPSNATICISFVSYIFTNTQL